MSNGESLDGFVFPPFIPTASARPTEAPPAAPQPPAPPEAPEEEPAEASGRMTMPWDLETPIVRDADAAPAPQPAQGAADDADDGEDLPWLEVPAPRETEEPAPAAPPAADAEAFPDWMAWDEASERAAEAEMHDSVAPVAGLEDFVPVDDLGGFIAPAPAVDWAESEPAEPAPSAYPATGDEPGAFDAGAEAAEFPEPDFDALLAPADAPAEDAPAAEDWSLDAPEAAPPPQVGEELTVEVTLEEEPAAPAASADPQPFVADDEAVMASEPAPSAAAEHDALTAVAEAGSAAPAEHADASPFDDVAGRLEEIARALRDRPDELLAGGSSDPLALLVTGYVMGYTARGR